MHMHIQESRCLLFEKASNNSSRDVQYYFDWMLIYKIIIVGFEWIISDL